MTDRLSTGEGNGSDKEYGLPQRPRETEAGHLSGQNRGFSFHPRLLHDIYHYRIGEIGVRALGVLAVLVLFNIPFLDINAVGAETPQTKSTPKPEFNLKGGMPSQRAVLASPQEFIDMLKVSEAWLIDNHPAVQTQVDRIDPITGELVEKIATVNNTLTNLDPAKWENSMIYVAKRLPSPEIYQAKLRSNFQNIGASLPIFPNELINVGEKRFRWGDAAMERCYLEILRCDLIEFPEGTYGVPSELKSVYRSATNEKFLIETWFEGAREFLGSVDRQTAGVQVSVMTDNIHLTGVGASGALEVTASYPLTNTVRTIGVASLRAERGIDVSTKNLETLTAETNNYLANEVGFADGKTIFNNGTGKSIAVSNAFLQFIAIAPLDSEDKPIWKNYTINTSNLFDDANSPYLFKGRGEIYSFYGAKMRSDGKLVFGFLGSYPLSVPFGGSNHQTIGHLIVDMNPVPLIESKFWMDAAPIMIGSDYVGTFPPLQRTVQIKNINAGLGVEFTVNSRNNIFAGRRVALLNPDLTLTGEIINLDNGLEKGLNSPQSHQILLPNISKN